MRTSPWELFYMLNQVLQDQKVVLQGISLWKGGKKWEKESKRLLAMRPKGKGTAYIHIAKQ